ncbi:hypothetical protein PCC7424_5376 (plasmid) [Gloeothece citriformis PCC 7424]|uniref:Uncharacterized protein n=1 Tax=Gloeothece citriformis (strain PCC 7424) TaxID=65393 RepID=B7KMD4_GLOC7|nr:hypothetical protein [Gloeothece citriformis]ACK73956.1 hypothetical protein PCC7424_5376 [Gloeothece citriformis PCC 7424]
MTPDSITRQIQQLEKSGEVAQANTWISSYVVTKKSGKSYRYYRLMKTYRDDEGKLKRKMVKYLGSESSTNYKNMKQAIARRNKIQQLYRKLKRLVGQQRARGQQGIRRGSSSATTLIGDKALLLSLQHQLQVLTSRFEELEGELIQLNKVLPSNR